MESRGAAGRIQITASTHELIRDAFECVPRGPVVVKGKGAVDAWFLLGRRGEAAPATSRVEVSRTGIEATR